MRAAIPRYVGEHYDDCPPGHRFGLYFPVWKDDWSIEKDRKGQALEQTLKLPTESIRQLEALRRRQALLLDAYPEAARLSIEAKTTAPFATGLGLEHPLENGFAFLNPYGLAYLPGSAIKGVLRRAAEELAGEPIEADRKGWTDAAITALFGLESEVYQKEHLRGVLTFWDALPRPRENSLGMDVMTPHYSDYYQAKRTALYPDGVTPHDTGQPNPIVFLVVPEDSQLSFHLICDLARLPAELADTWQYLIRVAFEHAFEWLGFGAKTAVGYGAMRRDAEAEQRAVQARAEREAEALRQRKAEEEAARRAQLSEAQRAIEDFVVYMRKRHESLRGRPNRPNGEEHNRVRQFAKTALQSPDWTAEEKRAAAEAIAEWLPKVVTVDMKEERKKLKLAQLRGEA